MRLFARFLILVFCSVLLGCNGAGPHFTELTATRVTIDGSTFDVRVQQNLAEAIRVNSEYAPRLGPIATRAGRAMELVSGCYVVQIRGDAAVTTGVLDCGQSQLVEVLLVGVHYECYAVETYIASAGDTQYVEYECDAVPN
ncbi:MAG: hypothetical protein AB8B47_15400 [Roseobacter sp.]